MRQWAISIGINQYQSFQPLSYAQHDAQAMQQFLVADAGVPAEQCVLLTETSPPLWGKATYPDRDTIQNWLDFIVQRCVQPGDVLWFFFSGHGLCQQGQDYLIPIAGTPAAIPTTAIPLEAIFRSLRRVTDATVLVLLDMSRNESSFSYETVGNHAAHLASITGIPTILSCQPGQFSRETSALGHGFFTAALLESLRSRQATTVAALDQMLSVRLPALGEHYWRPIQQPVTICPPEKRQQLLLPTLPQPTPPVSDRPIDMQTAIANSAAFLAMQASGSRDRFYAVSGNESPTGSAYPVNGNGSANGNGGWAPSGALSANGSLAHASIHTNGTNGSAANGGEVSYTNGGTIPTGAMRDTTASLPLNGDGAAINAMQPSNGMPVAPALQNGIYKPIDTPTQNYENGGTPSERATTLTPPQTDSPEDPNEISDALFWRSVLRWGGFVVVGLILGVLLRNCAAFTPKTSTASKTSTAQRTATASTGQTSAGQQPPSAKPNTQPGATVVPAVSPAVSPSLQPIASTQFGASGTSRLNVPSGKPATVQAQPAQTTGKASIAKKSAPSSSPLAKARALTAVNSDQASPYSDAIQEAQKVQPGQPDYPQAKQAIADWSGQILRIARQRGRQGRFDAAIVAVQLIPQNQAAHAEARSALDRWCPALTKQRGVNPVQKKQAKQTCLKGIG